jgi:phosphatidylserine synthase
VVAVAAGLKYVKDVNRENAKLDFAGMALLAAALLLFSLGATGFSSEGLTLQNGLLMIIGALLISRIHYLRSTIGEPNHRL